MTFGITTNNISTISQEKIENCDSFISQSGSLSFYAAQVYSILKNTELQKKYLLVAVQNGVDLETVLNYEFVQPLIESEPDFLNQIQQASLTYLNSELNVPLRNKIDALYMLNQEVRTEGRTFIDTKEVTDVNAVDAHILEMLDAELESGAFTEQNISISGTFKLWTILLHSLTNVSDVRFNKYEKVLKSATCAGRLNPQYLASIIDRRRRFNEQMTPLYYEYNLEKEIPANIREVSALRYGMGLEPLFRNIEMIDSIFQLPCVSCP